jgi:hypothetical protein
MKRERETESERERERERRPDDGVQRRRRRASRPSTQRIGSTSEAVLQAGRQALPSACLPAQTGIRIRSSIYPPTSPPTEQPLGVHPIRHMPEAPHPSPALSGGLQDGRPSGARRAASGECPKAWRHTPIRRGRICRPSDTRRPRPAFGHFGQAFAPAPRVAHQPYTDSDTRPPHSPTGTAGAGAAAASPPPAPPPDASSRRVPLRAEVGRRAAEAARPEEEAEDEAPVRGRAGAGSAGS